MLIKWLPFVVSLSNHERNEAQPALSLMPFRVRQREWETSRMPIPDSRFPRHVSAQRGQPLVIRSFVDTLKEKC
jgi:hypothetical protein